MLQIDFTLTTLIVLYHVCVCVFFSGVYSVLGIKGNFNYIDKTPMNALTPLYFTAVTHTTTGFGDITPKTDLARIVVIVHLLLAWAVPMLIFFSSQR